MSIAFLLERLQTHEANPALIWHDQTFFYRDLTARVQHWRSHLLERGVPEGAVIGLQADYSPNAIAVLLALFQQNCIVSLSTTPQDFSKRNQIAGAEWSIHVPDDDSVTLQSCENTASHPLINHLRSQQHAGLILFTSGSTGQPKGVVHDITLLLNKFQANRPALRTLLFLLFDHIGGINVLFHSLSNGACAVVTPDRSPETVAATIARHQVQALPTSPTFLSLLLLNEAHIRHDLSSLQVVNYATEVMPESLLTRLNQCLPNTRFMQSYGMTELGIMRSKSRSSDTLWVKVGGEDYQTRVVNGMLEIKAKSAMLGYLNAPAPFTEDGWYMTGDAVEVDGEWLRILGRTSELINVGGRKVYPAEIENVIQAMQGVADVAVKGEPNALMGNIVTARVRLTTQESLREFRTRLHAFCQGKLENYKLPARVTLVEEELHSTRFKKLR